MHGRACAVASHSFGRVSPKWGNVLPKSTGASESGLRHPDSRLTDCRHYLQLNYGRQLGSGGTGCLICGSINDAPHVLRAWSMADRHRRHQQTALFRRRRNLSGPARWPSRIRRWDRMTTFYRSIARAKSRVGRAPSASCMVGQKDGRVHKISRINNLPTPRPCGALFF